MGQADVQKAARRLVHRLEELGIEYVILGGLAVFAHGHQRVTADVDVLLTPEGLARFKSASLGRGWVEKFRGSRGVRDVVHDVPIDVILAGEAVGQCEGLVFPEPAAVAIADEGISVVSLPTLIELKLASGLSAPDRPRDFDDVIQLIRKNDLAEDLGARLAPTVRAKYHELWGYARRPSDECGEY